jgi:hypothetical protein
MGFFSNLFGQSESKKNYPFYKVYTPNGLQLVNKIEEMLENNESFSWGGEIKLYEKMFGKIPVSEKPEELKNFDKNDFANADEAAVKYLELLRKYPEYTSKGFDNFDKLVGIENYLDEPETSLKYIAGDYLAMLSSDLAQRHVSQYSSLKAIGESEAIQEFGLNIHSDESIHDNLKRVDWLEEKTIVTSINYGGFQYRLGSGNGFSYRMGNLNVVSNTIQKFTTVDRGTLYITNKRIIFVGTENRVNKTINLDDILEFTIFRDGILIGKSNGKKPLIHFPEWIIQRNKAPVKRDHLNRIVRVLDRVLKKNQNETIENYV